MALSRIIIVLCVYEHFAWAHRLNFGDSRFFIHFYAFFSMENFSVLSIKLLRAYGKIDLMEMFMISGSREKIPTKHSRKRMTYAYVTIRRLYFHALLHVIHINYIDDLQSDHIIRISKQDILTHTYQFILYEKWSNVN